MSDSYMDDDSPDGSAAEATSYLPTGADMRGSGLPDVNPYDDDVFNTVDDESQDPAHRTPGAAIEFTELEVPDQPHLGPTIGLGPDDLPPYTHDERGDH